MTKLYVKANGIEQLIAIGRKKDMEKLKEKMIKDKQKMKQFKIEGIRVE